MINFKQKEFTEYPQMRLLYNELMRQSNYNRRLFPIIDTSALIPILRGNNIVIESINGINTSSGSTTKCLTEKGTWASFTNNVGTVTSITLKE